jgi:ubiquitin thioesterase OTU1
MTSNLTLRVRTKTGMIKIPYLTSESTLKDLKTAISDLTGLSFSSVKILKGYPPKLLEGLNEESSLGSLSIKDGELFTLQETPNTELSKSSHETKTTITSKKTIEDKQPSQIKTRGVLLRKVVPSNNSCLFTSIHFVMENGDFNLDCQRSLRELIARTVKQDPVTFNQAILGKSNSDYCKWIQNPTSWGGSIEVMIMSKYYKVEICVVDIRSGRIDRFGEDCSYPLRVFIIYDGIHFDPLYLSLNGSSSLNPKIQTKFSADDEFVMIQALEMAEECKKARQFTDVNNFKLKCLCCHQQMNGQKAAQEHAEKTGHSKFGEV